MTSGELWKIVNKYIILQSCGVVIYVHIYESIDVRNDEDDNGPYCFVSWFQNNKTLIKMIP